MPEVSRSPASLRPPAELRPHPENARLYGEHEDQALTESIRQHGVLVPLLVTPDGLIVSGHRRWRAARALGLANVPVERFLDGDDLDVLEALLHANRQREKTPEQKVREFQVYQRIEAERAQGRMLAGVRANERGADPEETFPQGRAPQSRDLAARRVGLSGRSAEKGVEVVAAMDKLEQQGEMQQAAALHRTLNSRGIHPAHAQARRAGLLTTPAVSHEQRNGSLPVVPASVRIEVADAAHLPIADGTVDLIVSSPPFGLGKDYGGPEDEPLGWDAWLGRCVAHWLEKTAPGGRLALNVPLDTTRGDHRPTYAQAVSAALLAGWTYRFTIVWNEQNITRSTGRGSVDSAQAPHVIAPVEMIAVFGKLAWLEPQRCEHAEHWAEIGWEPGPDGEAPACPAERSASWSRPGRERSDLTREEWLAWTNGLWTFPGESRPWEGHPAAFPPELPRRLVTLLSFPGDTVLDPFCGSGTTVLVAHELGRQALGFDLSPEYVQSARRRLGAEVARAR